MFGNTHPALRPVSSSLSESPHARQAAEGSDAAGLGLPTRGHPCSPSPWLAASLAPLFLLSGPPLGFLPIHLLSCHRTPAPTVPAPRNLRTSTLDWAGDVAASQGAEVTGPKASYESVAGNSHLLLILHFLTALLAPLLPPPHPSNPLTLSHALGSQSCPVQDPHLLPLLSEAGLGLLAWARLSYFGPIRSIQTSGP